MTGFWFFHYVFSVICLVIIALLAPCSTSGAQLGGFIVSLGAIISMIFLPIYVFRNYS